MEDSEQTLFLRKNANTVSNIMDDISQDVRLLNMLRAQDLHVLRYFLTSLLFFGLTSYDGVHPKILMMFANAAAQIFDPDSGEEAFDIIIEHTKHHQVSMSNTVLNVLRITLVKSLISSKNFAPLSSSSILRSSFISPTLLTMDSDICDWK